MKEVRAQGVGRGWVLFTAKEEEDEEVLVSGAFGLFAVGIDAFVTVAILAIVPPLAPLMTTRRWRERIALIVLPCAVHVTATTQTKEMGELGCKRCQTLS